MATIAEHENSMTVFFRKANGEIKCIMTGINDMSAFGDEKADFSLIWDYVVLPKDDFVIQSPFNFKINLKTKTLELKVNSLNYPVVERS